MSKAEGHFKNASYVLENLDNNSAVKVYATGVIDGVLGHSITLKYFEFSNLICQPLDNRTNSIEHLKIIEGEYLKNKDKWKDLPFSFVVYLVLSELYPC
ncbi:MAG: hypothetical protein O2784_06730 [Proteobacteria bacterium]|nr:hypothetical protein [Pseudomonadota bacterium]